jgi:hypothetical protein
VKIRAGPWPRFGRFPQEESLYLLASHHPAIQYFSFDREENDTLENLYCLRCNREIEVGHKSVAVYMFAQTVGIRPRQKSSAQRICFCPQCSVSLAMGPPPEGALNLAAWNMIRDLVGADPALNQAAWENLRGVVGLLPSGDPEPITVPRRAAASGYFEF